MDDIGVDFLNKSMKELGVTLQSIKSLNYSSLSYDFLMQEKKVVKEQLKNYDTLFMQKFQKLPSRMEKEPLRPLYMYYKKLKQGMVVNKNKRKSSVGDPKKESNKLQPVQGLKQEQRKSCKTFSYQNYLSDSNSENGKCPELMPCLDQSQVNRKSIEKPQNVKQEKENVKIDKKEVGNYLIILQNATLTKWEKEQQIRELMNQREKMIRVNY